MQIEQAPNPLEARMLPGYPIEVDGITESSLKGEYGFGPSVPAMLILALAVPVFQVRSISAVISSRRLCAA